MKYLVTGTLVTAGIVLGSVLGVRFAMEGDTSLAWTALGLGVLGWFVLIVCLWLYARSEADDAAVVYSPTLPHSPADGRARAQDRPWLTDPRLDADGYPGRGRARAQDRPWLTDPQPARTGAHHVPADGRARVRDRPWSTDPQPARTGAHDTSAHGRARAQDRQGLKDPRPARTSPYEAPAARFPRLPDPPARGRVSGQERAWRRDPQPVDRLRPVGK